MYNPSLINKIIGTIITLSIPLVSYTQSLKSYEENTLVFEYNDIARNPFNADVINMNTDEIKAILPAHYTFQIKNTSDTEYCLDAKEVHIYSTDMQSDVKVIDCEYQILAHIILKENALAIKKNIRLGDDYRTILSKLGIVIPVKIDRIDHMRFDDADKQNEVNFVFKNNYLVEINFYPQNM